MSETLSLPTAPAPATWFTPAQAAAHLGIAIQTLNNMRCVGTGPRFSRVGRIVRYRVRDLDKWLEAGK